MRTKLDAESFGQSLAIIIQIWVIFKQVMIETKVKFEFIVWVLEEGNEKFKTLLLGLAKEYKKSLKIKKVECTINFNLAPSCRIGFSVAPDRIQIASRVRGERGLNDIRIRFHLDDTQKGGGKVGGHKLKKNLEGEEVFGAQLLDFYLVNPDKIPEELKTAGWVFFWGTIYVDKHGNLFVRYLRWEKTRWVSGYNRLDLEDFWNGNDPAAVSANKN